MFGVFCENFRGDWHVEVGIIYGVHVI